MCPFTGRVAFLDPYYGLSRDVIPLTGRASHAIESAIGMPLGKKAPKLRERIVTFPEPFYTPCSGSHPNSFKKALNPFQDTSPRTHHFDSKKRGGILISRPRFCRSPIPSGSGSFLHVRCQLTSEPPSSSWTRSPCRSGGCRGRCRSRPGCPSHSCRSTGQCTRRPLSCR